MGSKNEVLRGPGWKDIAEMLAAFEAQNRVTIEVCLKSCGIMEEGDIQATAKAWALDADRRVVKPLASQSARCRAEGVRTLEGLLSYLLYQLDFQLAEHEWDGLNSASA